MPKFRSKLFAEGDLEQDMIKRLVQLASTPEDVFRRVIEIWPLKQEDATDSVRKELYEESNKQGFSLKTMSRSLSAAGQIIEATRKRKDALEDFVVDLQSAKYIDQSQTKTLLKNLVIYEELHFESAQFQVALQQAVQKSFPVVESILTSISTAIRFKNEYSVAEDHETYDPGDSFVEPIVLFQIDLDKFGTIERFNFALREYELNQLAKRIQLAGKQLSVIKERLK